MYFFSTLQRMRHNCTPRPQRQGPEQVAKTQEVSVCDLKKFHFKSENKQQPPDIICGIKLLHILFMHGLDITDGTWKCLQGWKTK